MTIAQLQIPTTSSLPPMYDDSILQRSGFVQFRDERSLVTRVYHLAVSLMKDLLFVVRYRIEGRSLEERIGKKVFWHPTEKGVDDWNHDSTAAAFFVHGLNGVPSIWTDHINTIAKEHPKMDMRAFHVPRQGDCSVEDAIRDIVKVIRSYHAAHPGRPIVLYGVSKGAQALLHMDRALEDLKDTPIYFQSIAGPHHGSYMMDLVSQIGLSFLYSKEAVDELKLQNQKSKEIIDHLRKRKFNPLRRYDFYATECDIKVNAGLLGTGHQVALPILAKREKHILLKGDKMAAHSNIVEEVCRMQLDDVGEWLKKY